MILAYYRVSDDEGGESRSPERQRQQLLAYAAAHFPGQQVRLVGDEGVSAFTETRRKGWLQVLKLVRAGQVDVLMATDLSRLHRRARDAIAFAELAVKSGVSLVLLHEAVDLTTAAGKLQYQVVVASHEFTRNTTSDKTRAAMAYKRARGEALGSVPLGWRVEVKDGIKMLVPDATEQATLQFILALRSEGLGSRAIAARLTAEGILSKTGKPYWARQTVAKILAAHEEGDR